MKKYISYFRMWLVMGLQYRAAAFGGIVTQFFWGFMEIAAMHAFHDSNPAAYPMTMEATCSYIWFQQAFIAMLSARIFDSQILDSVRSGDIAYELCRPVSIYSLWFSRSTASRLSAAGLRCIPILAVAVLLPASYRLSAPAGPAQFFFFLLTLALAVLVTVSFIMLIYISGLYTVSSDGIRRMCSSLMDFLTGAYIPLPFFPGKIRQMMKLLPFASMQNVPLRVYSGDLAGAEMYRAIFLQIFWLTAMVMIGRQLCRNAERNLMIQGG